MFYTQDPLTIERSQIIKHTGENEVGQLQKEKTFFFKTLFSPRLFFKGSLKNIWLKSRGGSHKLRFHHSNLIVLEKDENVRVSFTDRFSYFPKLAKLARRVGVSWENSYGGAERFNFTDERHRLTARCGEDTKWGDAKQQRIGEIGKKKKKSVRALRSSVGDGKRYCTTICSFFNIFFFYFRSETGRPPLSFRDDTNHAQDWRQQESLGGNGSLLFRCAPGGGFSNKKKEEASSHIYLYYSFLFSL